MKQQLLHAFGAGVLCSLLLVAVLLYGRAPAGPSPPTALSQDASPVSLSAAAANAWVATASRRSGALPGPSAPAPAPEPAPAAAVDAVVGRHPVLVLVASRQSEPPTRFMTTLSDVVLFDYSPAGDTPCPSCVHTMRMRGVKWELLARAALCSRTPRGGRWLTPPK